MSLSTKPLFQSDGTPPSGSDGKSPQADPSTPPEEITPPVYEEWVQTQPEPIKQMLSSWEGGLKSALTSERDARRSLERQVRELAGKAEKGSEIETRLTGLADQLSEAQTQNEFYDQASRRGVRDLKLAWLAAKEAGAIDGRGRINWDTLEETYPLLFSKKIQPPGHAGSGTHGGNGSGEGQPQVDRGMNAWIRAQSSRRP